MTRLSDLQGGQAASVSLRGVPRPRDTFVQVQRARAFRRDFLVERLHRGLAVLSRWTGLAALIATLSRRARKRRTLRALSRLDDRLLRDIGLARADIEATAAFCCSETPASGNAAWYGLSAWAERETRRRRTEQELSALSDAMLADIGIERAEIPAIAAAVADRRHDAEAASIGENFPRRGVPEPPLSAQVIAFTRLRRELPRDVMQDHDRSTAA